MSYGSDLLSAVGEDDREAVVAALDSGVPVDARGPLGRTACFLAASWSRPKILSLLIERGADVELPDECGNSPLMAAVMRVADNAEVIRLLLRAGADPMRPNMAGATPALMTTHLPAELRRLIPADPNPLGLPGLETMESLPNAIRLSVGGAPLGIQGGQENRDGVWVRVLYEEGLSQMVRGQPLTAAVQDHIRCYLVALGSPVEPY